MGAVITFDIDNAYHCFCFKKRQGPDPSFDLTGNDRGLTPGAKKRPDPNANINEENL